MYQELENKALAEFEEKFVEDRGRYVEPIFKDAVGSVGPIKNFLKSHLQLAYQSGVDKTIERFATGDFIRGEEAEKFRQQAIAEVLEELKQELFPTGGVIDVDKFPDKVFNKLQELTK
jgi:uncharacterized SAM-dependent methyltransferase